jgi:hypothetical protein
MQHVRGEPSGTTTNIFPRVLRFPLSVPLHQCPYSLHLDTTLSGKAHDLKKRIKLFSFMLFIYPWSPVATICIIAFYIQKSYTLPTEYSFTFRMTRTKVYFPVYNVCSMFTTPCELDLNIQCKLNSVFKGYRSILTNVISTKHWQS